MVNIVTTMKKNKRFLRKFLYYCITLILLFVLCIALLLKRGFTVESVSFNGLALTNLSLIWKHKLEVEIEHARFVNSSKEKFEKEERGQIQSVFNLAGRLSRYFSQVNVRSLLLEDFGKTYQISINTDQKPWNCIIAAAGVMIEANLTQEENGVKIDIPNIEIEKYGIDGVGSFLADYSRKEIKGEVVNGSNSLLPARVELTITRDGLDFSGAGTTPVKSISQIIELFGLDNTVRPWIVEYLTGEEYLLKTISGFIPWQKPGSILKTLSGEVEVKGCHYTFTPGLEPIKSSHTEVAFDKGILTIKPYNATFYGQSTEDSWLDINFSDTTNIILSAYITTRAKANEDIITLLNYYDISLPFKQIAGHTSADLVVTVNLTSGNAKTTGTLGIDSGIIEWNERVIHIDNTKVAIAGRTISIERLGFGIKNRVHGNLSGSMDAASKEGRFNVEIDDLLLQNGNSAIELGEIHPTAVYHIGPDEHHIVFAQASYRIGDLQFRNKPFSVHVDPADGSVSLPLINLSSLPYVSITLSGNYSASEQRGAFKGEIDQFQYRDLQLLSDALPFEIHYDGGVTISLEHQSMWSHGDTSVVLNGIQAGYSGGKLETESGPFQYGTVTADRLVASFSFPEKRGKSTLIDTRLAGIGIGTLNLNLLGSGDSFTVLIPELDLKVETDRENNFSIVIDDIEKLHDRFSLLQKLEVKKGAFHLFTNSAGEGYDLSLKIEDPPPLLIKNGDPIARIDVRGSFHEGNFTAEVNKDLRLSYTNNWQITSSGVSYNVPELIKRIEKIRSLNPNSQPEEPGSRIELNAKDSGLYFAKDMEAPADAFTIEYGDGIVVGELHHHEGRVDIRVEDGIFQFISRKLDSDFINGISRQADFQHGEVGFVAYGRADKFSAILKIKDATLKKFATLSKILAFINTVPDLATFSLPQFGSNGLPVTSATVGGTVEDGVITIRSFDMQSPQMSMTGAGWVDITDNSMDMEFNLITAAKKKISKIPLLGYIMVGKKELPSITVKATGDMKNPIVETSMFKEIATIPFSMLYRTLTLPYKVVEPLYNSQ